MVLVTRPSQASNGCSSVSSDDSFRVGYCKSARMRTSWWHKWIPWSHSWGQQRTPGTLEDQEVELIKGF